MEFERYVYTIDLRPSYHQQINHLKNYIIYGFIVCCIFILIPLSSCRPALMFGFTKLRTRTQS